MNNLKTTDGASFGAGFNRMVFEDASSVVRLNRGLTINASTMTYGAAFKCRWAKIRSHFAG